CTLRKQLARVLTTDHRYSYHAYAFILEALHQARQLKLKSLARDKGSKEAAKSSGKTRPAPESSEKRRVQGHVDAAELCDAVRKLGLRQYGSLAAMLLAHWGVRSTSDIGEIVYNLIVAGDLEKTEGDSRSDFDNLFDFAAAFKT